MKCRNCAGETFEDFPAPFLPRGSQRCVKCGEVHVPDKILDRVIQIPQYRPVQCALNEQLMNLLVAANKLGLYDAADFLKNAAKL